jgi:hypothetical protein
MAAPSTAALSFRVNSDSAPATSATDDAESPLTAWTFTKDLARSTTFDWGRKSLSGAQNVWRGPDPTANADIALVSPPLTVAATGRLGMVLNHRWDFEASGGVNYDGAVIEISTNGGTTWADIGATAAGYTGTLGGTGSVNPLVGRQAFTGSSAGYPQFVSSTLDLGPAYAGQTVQVRLRIGSDAAVGGLGWELDSIGFTGITNTPFPTLVADRGLCINRPPVANAGPDLVVDERTPVALSSAASTDPDGNPLTARWVQQGGPMVTLTNGAFTAPEVTADTALTFQLIVNDGTVDSAPDTVQVTVRQVNRSPVAAAGPDQAVDERTLVTLAGSGSDPDGDPLTFSWTQVSGPPVALSDSASLTAQFTAPEVTADAEVVLQLVVSDGTLPWASSQVTIAVRQVNREPSVTVSIPANAPERSVVSLSATGSDPDSDALTYSWTQTSGPPVTLLTPSSATATFVAPEVTTSPVALSFQVAVSDGVATASATGTVNITEVNRPPVAVIAGSSRDVTAGEVVSLDASGSSDPDGDPLTFAWTQSGAAPLEGADTAVATVTMPTSGTLDFTVTVSDPAGAKGEASITLRAAPVAPKGCGCSSSSGVFLGVILLALRRRRRDG